LHVLSSFQRTGISSRQVSPDNRAPDSNFFVRRTFQDYRADRSRVNKNLRKSQTFFAVPLAFQNLPTTVPAQDLGRKPS
jgi:hypothetical protein